MIKFTTKEKSMSRSDARIERQRLNAIVSNCYDAFEDDERDLKDKIADHIKKCQQAEHERTMHIMFMYAMGWI